MWTRTSICRQNGYGITELYPYEVTAGGAAAGKLLRGVTGSRQTLPVFKIGRVGKGLTHISAPRALRKHELVDMLQRELNVIEENATLEEAVDESDDNDDEDDDDGEPEDDDEEDEMTADEKEVRKRRHALMLMLTHAHTHTAY